MSGEGLGATTARPVPLQREGGGVCGWCQGDLRGRQKDFCSDRCRWKSWDAKHPRLDFTPAASHLAHALRGRETKAQKILARLRIAPATSLELAKITHRFSARIYDLRAQGHRIPREDFVKDGHEWSVYSLEGE